MGANRYSATAPGCFKAYDIRGKAPEDINAEFAFRLGGRCGEVFDVRTAVIGHDSRLSSPGLAGALAAGLASCDISVSSLGLCGTEEIYFATANGDFDIGIMVTGSHNPANQNGFKFVRRGAIPIGEMTGLAALQRSMQNDCAVRPAALGQVKSLEMRKDYLAWLAGHAPCEQNGRSLRVVVNAGNGSAGPFLQELASYFPFEIVPLHFEPDGHFPNGIPNPLLPERREDTARAVRSAQADVGVAFDGDFDRCFFYDEDGNFIEGYYLVGLLAESLLRGRRGQKIAHDPRLYWNTRDVVIGAGGIPVMSRTGHAFMKETMRAENALYGGEMSAHHYFRDFSYCDSGMLSMLTVLGHLQASSRTLGEMVSSRLVAYPCSGEINFRVANAAAIMDNIFGRYLPLSARVDRLDGINMELDDWRFSLRLSNTESLLRLNVESRGSRQLMLDKTAELTRMIRECALMAHDRE